MNELVELSNEVAHGLGLKISGQNLIEALKRTAFKVQVDDDQMYALMVIAKQYGLNPWTKEIYAFPDKDGIVPIVGVDGWMRIINSHPQFDGLEFGQDDESCTCIIYRKDRNHPTKVTEFMAECRRSKAGPWQTHPRRMLRHKALIQAARMAFGFAGIYDEDEAERIKENIVPIPESRAPEMLPGYTEDQFSANAGKWADAIESGKSTAKNIINMVSTKFTLSASQIEAIKNLGAEDAQFTEETI